MGKEGKRLKRCSTSTDVEAADPKDTKPLQKTEIAERELQDSETEVNPKKRKKKSERKQIDEDDLEPKKTKKKLRFLPKKKKKKEMKTLRKSFKEMTKTIRNLHDFFLSRADLPGISLMDMVPTKTPDTSPKEEEEEEEALEETEELATFECCFETDDVNRNNEDTVFVKGLDTSLSRADLESALKKHFESCGCEVTRVFVPIECHTGAPLGFAFIDVDDEQKAVKLGKGPMGGRMLYVMMAIDQPEMHNFPDHIGCEHCGTFLLQRRLERFYDRQSRGIRLYN